MKKIIDVSHWQNTINWPKVKASGIEGAIIKAGVSDAGVHRLLRDDGGGD